MSNGKSRATSLTHSLGMSPSTNARVARQVPRRQFTESTYRKAKPFLLRDFDGRCAYSLQHVKRVGYKGMEVDHFNPRLRGLARNKYANLFPATRHCNGSKSDHWPSAAARKSGIRFLNPCKEVDYGVHIIEDPQTHMLVGMTPAGLYHIRCCDLNAPHLVQERHDRARLWEILDDCLITVRGSDALLDGSGMLEISTSLRAIVEKMIPPILAAPVM